MMYCQYCGKRCVDLYGRYMPADGSRCGSGPHRVYCQPSQQDIARAALDRAVERVAELTAELYEAQEDALAAQERYHQANRAFLDSKESKS